MLKKITFLFALLIIVACSSSDDSNNNNGNTGDNFDRSALLANTADNIVIPAFQDLQSKLATLKTAIATFTTTPNQTNIDAASTAWLNAYKVWQHVEVFNIGRAESLGEYYAFMNIYPVTVADITNAATTGNYDLNTSNYHDAQGFPGLDYLLHSENALDFYTTNENAQGYKDFLTAIITRMDNLTTEVLNDWTSSYRDVFVASTENSATGSVNKLVSDFIFYYEKGFRTNKFGTPAGVFSSAPLPEKVEAFYKKDVSKTLALEAINSIKNVFNGRAYNATTTGASFATYLQELNRGELVTVLNDKFNAAQSKINVLDNNFYNQITSDNEKMTEAYDAIQAAVPNLKSDFTSALNVSIDFPDNDND